MAAIGIANQYFFLYNMALSGIIGGASLFIAQFYGKNDKLNIRKITGLSVISALMIGITFMIVALFSPKFIIYFFSKDLDVIKVADHIIDLGPEGGAGGGTIVVTGTPEKVAKCEKSYTGQFLKSML